MDTFNTATKQVKSWFNHLIIIGSHKNMNEEEAVVGSVGMVGNQLSPRRGFILLAKPFKEPWLLKKCMLFGV